MLKRLGFTFLLLSTDLYSFTDTQKAALAQHLIAEQKTEELQELVDHIHDIKEADALDKLISNFIKKGKAGLKGLEAILALTEAAEKRYMLWKLDPERVEHIKKATLYYSLLIENNKEDDLDVAVFENAGFALIDLTKAGATENIRNTYVKAAKYLNCASKKYGKNNTPLTLLEVLSFLHCYIARDRIKNKENPRDIIIEFAKASIYYEYAVHEIGIEKAPHGLLQNAGDVFFQMTSFAQGEHLENSYMQAAERYACAVQRLDPLSPDYLGFDDEFSLFTEKPAFLLEAALSVYSYIAEKYPASRETVTPYVSALIHYLAPLAHSDTDLSAYHIDTLFTAATAFFVHAKLTHDEASLRNAQKLYDYFIKHSGDQSPTELSRVAALYARLGHDSKAEAEKRTYFKRADELYTQAIDFVKSECSDEQSFAHLSGPDLWEDAVDNLINLALLSDTERPCLLKRAYDICDDVLSFKPLNKKFKEKRRKVSLLDQNQNKTAERSESHRKAMLHFEAFLKSDKTDATTIRQAIFHYENFFEGQELEQIEVITLGNAACAYFEYAVKTPSYIITALDQSIQLFELVAKHQGELSEMHTEWLKVYGQALGMCAQHLKLTGTDTVARQKALNLKAAEVYQALIAKLPEEERSYNLYSDAATVAFFLWTLSDNDNSLLKKAVEYYHKTIEIIQIDFPHMLKTKKELSTHSTTFIKHSLDHVPSLIFMNAAQACFLLANLSASDDNDDTTELDLNLKTYQYYTYAFWGHDLNAIDPHMLVEYADTAYFMYLQTSSKEQNYFDKAYEILTFLVDHDSPYLLASSWKQAGTLAYVKWTKGNDLSQLLRATRAFDRAILKYRDFAKENKKTLEDFAHSGLLEKTAHAYIELSKFSRTPLVCIEKALDYINESIGYDPTDKDMLVLRLQTAMLKSKLMRMQKT